MVLAAALIGKWQLASDGAVWEWVFNVMIGCLVVAEVFEITERRIRLRRGARQDEVNAWILAMDPRVALGPGKVNLETA